MFLGNTSKTPELSSIPIRIVDNSFVQGLPQFMLITISTRPLLNTVHRDFDTTCALLRDAVGLLEKWIAELQKVKAEPVVFSAVPSRKADGAGIL
jgi:hypothetical protein